jgi:hypothetical protein
VERRLFEMDIIKNTKTNEMRGCDKIYAVLAAHKHEYDEDLPDIYVLEFGRFPINEDFYNFEYSGSKQDINALYDLYNDQGKEIAEVITRAIATSKGSSEDLIKMLGGAAAVASFCAIISDDLMCKDTIKYLYNNDCDFKAANAKGFYKNIFDIDDNLYKMSSHDLRLHMAENVCTNAKLIDTLMNKADDVDSRYTFMGMLYNNAKNIDDDTKAYEKMTLFGKPITMYLMEPGDFKQWLYWMIFDINSDLAIKLMSDQGYASTVISKIQKEIDDAINRKNESNTRADAEIDILKRKLEDFKKLNCSGGGISWEDEK